MINNINRKKAISDICFYEVDGFALYEYRYAFQCYLTAHHIIPVTTIIMNDLCYGLLSPWTKIKVLET
jgi:hypothetical protein